MGNSDHGTTYMRVEGDDGELRSWLSYSTLRIRCSWSQGNPASCVRWVSYLRLIDSCITQLKGQGPFRTCNESKEEEEEGGDELVSVGALGSCLSRDRKDRARSLHFFFIIIY